MSEKVYLGEATVKDIPTIREIATLAFYKTYSQIISTAQIEYMLEEIYSAKSLNQQIEKLGHKFILLKVQEKTVGFASVSPTEGRLRLHKLYLHPEQKGFGYGRKLIEAVVKEAQMRGFKEIELNVNRANPSVKFYSKMGFVIERDEDVPIGNYFMNDYVMVLSAD